MQQALKYQQFGHKLKHLLQTLRAPVAQRELADKVGISYGFITHIETGRTLLGKGTLKALARALGVPKVEVLDVQVGWDTSTRLSPEMRSS